MAKTPKNKSGIAVNRQALFGPRPLLEGEDSAAYDKLLAQITEALKPKDIIEELWVYDVLNLSWEVISWRQRKSRLIKANLHLGLKTVLSSLTTYVNAKELAENWAVGDAESVERVDELLSDADLSMDEVVAETIAIKISDIERFDRLIMNAEARRNAVLREIDRYRCSKSQPARRAIETVEDAEYTEIKAPQIAAETPHGQ
jgi:hypothetical protein